MLCAALSRTRLRFLDLGSGSGRDCFAAAALVGEQGSVTGVDMTAEQLSIARENADEYCCKTLGFSKSNMTFKQGYIELLELAGIDAGAFDICMSNCVVNLSPDKPAVLREVYRALAVGGEFYFSDVYSDTRLADDVRKNEVLWGECIAGSLKIEDFEEYAVAAGFCEPRILAVSPIEIYDDSLNQLVGDAKFFSITYRLFKLDVDLPAATGTAASVAASTQAESVALATPSCDVPKAVCYKGSIQGMEDSYMLDLDTTFATGEPLRVDSLTAAVIECGWLRDHFDVTTRGAKHFAASGKRREARQVISDVCHAAAELAPAC